jgi:hypothetical protein
MPALLCFLLVASVWAAPARPVVYETHEVVLTASAEPANPLENVPRVTVKGPHMIHRLELFWAGGKEWRFRIMPLVPGAYSWVVSAKDTSLNGKKGTFTAVVNPQPAHALARLGPPWISKDRRHFAHADGTPWFWLADTAWSGALLATAEEWDEYLAERARQRFTAVQVVLTQWRAGLADENGRKAFAMQDGKLQIDPAFFERMDRRIAAINRHGLVAVPVMLWALTGPDKESPGESLSNEDCIRLASYLRARYHSHHVLWFLGGDGDYRGDKAEKWKIIGRAVFPENLDRKPVTLHPRGMQDPWPSFAEEPWLDFLIYQTGHGTDTRKWRWIAEQAMSIGWKFEPTRPVLDSEPNYEGHNSYRTGIRISDYHVRRAAYMGLLSAPVAGITYGAHGVWPWIREPGEPLNHKGSGIADPWRDCLRYPGAAQMTIMRNFLDRLPWTEFRPAQNLVIGPAPDAEFSNFISAARTEDGRIALVYTPVRQGVELDLSSFRIVVNATWLNPRNGQRAGAGKLEARKSVRMEPPEDGDWLLLLEN